MWEFLWSGASKADRAKSAETGAALERRDEGEAGSDGKAPIESPATETSNNHNLSGKRAHLRECNAGSEFEQCQVRGADSDAELG